MLRTSLPRGCEPEADARTDLYALGVTLYFALTRHYPYGEIEPFQSPHFGAPASPTRYRSDLPTWFENILLKAIVVDPALRFETAEELLLALERGAARPLAAPRAVPLVAQSPAARWRIAALVSLALNFVVLLWWLTGV